jgi:hypothetical protein
MKGLAGPANDPVVRTLDVDAVDAWAGPGSRKRLRDGLRPNGPARLGAIEGDPELIIASGPFADSSEEAFAERALPPPRLALGFEHDGMQDVEAVNENDPSLFRG